MKCTKLNASGGLVAVVLLLSTPVQAQVTPGTKLQADIVTAVAQALGAVPDQLPDYNAELQTARHEADVATICGGAGKPRFLNPTVANKVVARALDLVKQSNAAVAERPQYVTDLIIASAVSFEAGRLAGSTPEYRAALCAPPAPPPLPQPAPNPQQQ